MLVRGNYLREYHVILRMYSVYTNIVVLFSPQNRPLHAFLGARGPIIVRQLPIPRDQRTEGPLQSRYVKYQFPHKQLVRSICTIIYQLILFISIYKLPFRPSAVDCQASSSAQQYNTPYSDSAFPTKIERTHDASSHKIYGRYVPL